MLPESIVPHIVDVLQEQSITVREIKLFGSALDKSRFDREGEKTSDIDLLAVVATLPGVCDDSSRFFREFKFFRLDPDNDPEIRCHHLRGAEWDGGRNIDLLLMTDMEAETLMAEGFSVIQEYGGSNAFVHALFNGQTVFSPKK